MQNEQQRSVDSILKAGLESYADAQPLAGLEERVLRRVQERRIRNKWVWFGLAAATACACLMLAVVFGLARESRNQAGPAQATTAAETGSRAPLSNLPNATERAGPHTFKAIAASELERQAVHAHGGMALVALKREPKPERLPKLDMFPTPHPLTPEDRALVEFVDQHPKEVQELVDAEKRRDEPIQIAAIHIEPLKVDGPQPKGGENAQNY